MSDKLTKRTAVISSLTVLSRIFGLVRDKSIAFVFGATGLTDAFIVAFRIPNLLRRLLAEGSLAAAFIPVFSELEQKKGRDDAWLLGSASLNMMFLVLALVALAGMGAAPALVRILTLEFSEATSPYFDITVALTRIMFPYLIAVGMAALLMGMLNAKKHFALPAFAPVVLNIAIIAGVWLLAPRLGAALEEQVFALAYGVLLGGAAQFLIQLPPLCRLGYRHRWLWSHPALRKVFVLMVPGAIALVVAEVNVIVDTMLAWHLGEGTVAALFWGNRIMQLPLGVFGIAIATAILPTMAQQYVNHRLREYKRTLAEGVRLMLAILIPATLALIVLGRSIVRVLLQGGSFTNTGTEMVTFALTFYVLGLCSYAGVKIFAQAFFAMQDTGTPMRVAIVAMILNIVLNLLLIVPLSFGGLALATALSSTFNLLALVVILRRRIGLLHGREIARVTGKVALATLLMTLTLASLLQVSDPAANESLTHAAGLLLVYITIGLAVYLGAAVLLKLEEAARMFRLFRTAVLGR